MINQELVKKLASQLKKDGVDAIMIAPGADMVFLLGHKPLLCERYQALFVKSDETCFYICNALYTDEVSDFVDGGKIYSWHDRDGFEKTVKKAFEEQGLVGKTVAINGNVRAFNLIKAQNAVDFKAVDGKDYIELTRIIKTPEELENLRKSSLIADKAFEGIKKFIKPGVTEKDINDELTRIMMENGADYTWGGIVAVDGNAALPHYMGNSGVVGKKAIVLMDYGCIYKGMFSDTTRTVFVGRATEREKEIYNIVLQANLAGERAAKNGAWIPDVDAAARKVIADRGYGPRFNHRLGHGIGYAEHEAPYIRGDYEMHLAPGMAFSCEPGIYLKDDIGIRIEDVVIINEKGETEVLNHTSKELCELCVDD